jgi:hypothetical protein
MGEPDELPGCSTPLTHYIGRALPSNQRELTQPFAYAEGNSYHSL